MADLQSKDDRRDVFHAVGPEDVLVEVHYLADPEDVKPGERGRTVTLDNGSGTILVAGGDA